MKRFVIFAVIAPALSFVTAFWVMLQLANWAAGSPLTFDFRQIALLPNAYLIGLVPALLAALYDYFLAEAKISYRIALTAMIAYAISYVPLVIAFATDFIHGPYFLLFGLVGALPGALCSWLATDSRRQILSV